MGLLLGSEVRNEEERKYLRHKVAEQLLSPDDTTISS